MSTIQTLTTSLRILTHDAPDDKVIFSEQLGGSDMPAFPVDGSNKVFRLKSVPLADVTGIAGAALYTWLTIRGTGAVQRTHAGFKIDDPANGIVEFTVAPNPGSTNPTDGVYFDYNYFWFSDVKYQEFLNQAANMTVAGVVDATQIVEGLIEAMLQYGVAYFWKARASAYGDKIESTGGDASNRPQTVTQAFLALAKEAQSRGDFLKLDYYKRQGQRELPSSQDGNVNFDPISPMR